MIDGAFFQRLGRRELVMLDGAVAAFLAFLFFALARTQSWDVFRVTVIALMALPVAVRRLWPVPVFAITATMSIVAAACGVVTEPFLAAGYALFWVAATRPRTQRVPTRAIALLSVTQLPVGLLVGKPGGSLQTAVQFMGLALVGMAWVAGRAMNERLEYHAQSARQLVAQAVSEERLRIARELHDIVAHNIGVVAVKAGVINHVLPIHPPEASEALRDIEAASRAAMTEMRHMLSVLRSDADEVVDVRPSVGLSDLPELVCRAEAAGVRTEVEIRNVAGLPEGTDRSAYRILQEALTNVIKHAAPTRCRVVVEADGEQVLIEVSDDGRRHSSDSPDGHGLIGMRERVAFHGGEFHAGPRPEGGFTVRARLPY